MQGVSCGKCAGKRKSTEEFIKECKFIHGDKYDYGKVVYSNSRSKIIIKCKKHGYFTQSPSSHLRGSGCCKCAKSLLGDRYRKYTTKGRNITNRLRGVFQSWIIRKAHYIPATTSRTFLISKLVGICNDELATYIESQFTEGMTWDTIHIDHHIPLSFFDPTKEEDLKMAWNYRNLRPLLVSDNCSKSAKLPDDWEAHLEMLREAVKDSPPLDMEALLR